VLTRKKEKPNFTHVEAEVALLERWNFPRELVEAVALHHQQPGGQEAN